MPLDGQIEKPDVFTAESALAWFEKQDPDREYDFWDRKVCALGQYLVAHGRDPASEYDRLSDVTVSGPLGDLGVSACMEPRTFGALASRIRSHMGEG